MCRKEKATWTSKSLSLPEISAGRSNRYYVSNRQPLTPSPLVKLPLGAVRPAGWLRTQLDLMVEGLTGRLEEISLFLASDNGWLNPAGTGWEEGALLVPWIP